MAAVDQNGVADGPVPPDRAEAQMSQGSPATRVFFQTVRDHMRKTLSGLSPDDPLRDLVGVMSTRKLSAVVLADSEGAPRGIVTEQDVVRRIAFRADAAQRASDIMSYPLRTAAESDPLYVALARMRRFGHRHLPVVDRDGKLSGVLDLHRVMATAASDLVARVDSFAYERTREGLRETKAAQTDLAAELLEEGVKAPEIQALITHMNNGLYQDLLALNAAEMENEGLGAAPLPFCMVIMGSGGRGENYLSPDQDYGFIIADAHTDEVEAADPWFVELATRLSRDVDAAGLPFCSGDVMATNPLWRQTLSGWKAQVDKWNAATTNQAFLDFDIFFDFQPVSGEVSLGRELRDYVTRLMDHNEPFLRRLFAADRDHGTALRSFGRWATSSDAGPNRGKMDLKLHGTFPLVQGIRLLSLREGVTATSTLARLDSLKSMDMLNAADHEDLTAAYVYLSNLIFSRQVAEARAGGSPSYHVHPKSLSRRVRRQLRDALETVEGLLTRIKFEFGGELY